LDRVWLILRREAIRLDELGGCLLQRYHHGVKPTRLTVGVMLNKGDR
jgi:hypothetical protein